MIYMRLSEIESFDAPQLIMVKFTSKDWIDSFLDGSIYMNNFKHFIDQEESSKLKGQGDAYEGAHVLEIISAKLYDQENRLLATASSGSLVERHEIIKNIPMFCMASFGADDFIVLEHGEDYINLKLDIPAEDIKKIKETFKTDTVAVTVNPHAFIRHFDTVAKKKDLGLCRGMVDYCDYKILDTTRKKSFDEGEVDVLFTKHNSLSYQKEYRFVLTNVQSEKPYTIELGDLRSMFAKMDTDTFLSGAIWSLRK